MTPDEKAIIDAKREAWAECLMRFCHKRERAEQAAADRFPYPPPPVVWREVVRNDGYAYRRVNGAWEMRPPSQEWRRCPWYTDDLILALARCVTEPTMGEGEG